MVDRKKTVPGLLDDDWWTHMTDPLRTWGGRIADFFSPSSDASATHDTYEICMELPGVTQDDIHVEIDDSVLKISGEKTSEEKKEGKDYYFSERRYGSFSRSFRLPEDADVSKIHATHKDGVLTVHIAKLESRKPETRKIDVNAG